jgi:hypothetical protein
LAERPTPTTRQVSSGGPPPQVLRDPGQPLNPAEIINLFNYGELIHFGPHSEEYDKLAEDPELEAIQHNNFKQAMLGLIHLYFGFSEVIRSAIGLRSVEAA